MTTKKLLIPLAVMIMLPLGANATIGPDKEYGDSPAFADYDPPYATVIISNDDAEHIASTAYVKGAYNDTVAALNTLDNNKQTKIINLDTNVEMEAGVGYTTGEDIAIEVIANPETPFNSAYRARLGELFVAGDGLAYALAQVVNYVNDKTVEIYTTWDEDNTTTVELSSAQ